MIDLVTYTFKALTTGKITPEEYFMNAYVEELVETEHIHTSNNQLFTILDANTKRNIKIK